MTPAPPTILIVDDDAHFRMAAAEALRGPGATVLEAESCAAALAACARQRVDVVILDQKLPDGSGVELCPRILEHNDRTKIVAATAFPEFSHAVAALRAGAFDYVSKPVELEELEHVVATALRTIELEGVAAIHQYESVRARSATTLVGGDGGLATVRRLADLAAQGDAPVLITGETGTGKNVLARYIHFTGSPSSAPFVAVNAAALPRELVESELFGHERGAFTGAGRLRRGVFEMADGGTLFLDEIGSLALDLQAKLLAVLEDGQIRRVGGELVHPVRVRVVAATNADLEAAVRARTFREDLFYRLNVIHLHLPPLRERRQDLGPLCQALLAHLAGRREVEIPEDELGRLAAYDWPGNVRELRNVLERTLTLQHGRTLRPSEFLPRPARPPAVNPDGDGAGGGIGALVPLEEIERRHVLSVLERVGGNLARAARVLQVSESTLRRKLQTYRAARAGPSI